MQQELCRTVFLTVVLEYNGQDPTQNILRTNMTEEAAKDILGKWLNSQGVKPDHEIALAGEAKYRVKIQESPGGSSFMTQSDANNEVRTIGIVMSMYNNFDQLQRQPFETEEQF